MSCSCGSVLRIRGVHAYEPNMENYMWTKLLTTAIVYSVAYVAYILYTVLVAC